MLLLSFVVGSTITVTAADPTTITLASTSYNVYINESFTLFGTLTDANGIPLTDRPVALSDFNGDPIATLTTNDTGGFSYTISGFSEGGAYSYTVYYAGDARYSGAGAGWVAVSVHQFSSAITLASTSYNVYINESFTLFGTLTDENGTALTGRPVVITTSNGDPIATLTTNDTGGFSYTISGFSEGGGHWYSVSYAGDARYSGASAAPFWVYVGQFSSAITLESTNYSPYVNESFTCLLYT